MPARARRCVSPVGLVCASGPGMNKNLLFVPVVALVVTAAPACATKKQVRGSVGHVNGKVEDLNRQLEDVQERTTKTERRIGDVDQKVANVNKSAASARRTADTASNSATRASNRIEALDRKSKRLVYDVTLSEDQGQFDFGHATLPVAAKARIDDLVRELIENPQAVYIEIEGHTDDVGSPEANRRLGLARAEAAKRYIHEQHSVPLHKINVISFGEDRPAASNKSNEGRAQNRRIVIRVLS
jgi:outer membrane protein OmpA-like peptidoglycan-associated protein